MWACGTVGRGHRFGGPDGGSKTVPRYRRVVVKLSGEALAGSANTGVDPASLSRVAQEVLSLRDLGVQVAVVVGGGNYFRGRMAEGWGISRAEADNIVMLAGGIGQPYVTSDYPAVQRSLELDADALLVAKRGVDGVYDSDPNINP